MYILYMMHNIDAYRILLYDEKRALSQKILATFKQILFCCFQRIYYSVYYTVHVHVHVHNIIFSCMCNFCQVQKYCLVTCTRMHMYMLQYMYMLHV